MLFKENSVARSVVEPTPVVGTATWRFELDSLDWRRKVTLRLSLKGPSHAVYVIRTAGARAPNGILTVKNIPNSHIDPRYYTARLSVSELGERRVYDDWNSLRDTVIFTDIDSLSPRSVLRGTVRLEGYHSFSSALKPGESYPGQKAGEPYPGQLTVRRLEAAFAATFDPRPTPSPRTMTPDLARRIMTEALYEYAVGWMGGGLNPGPADSTRDNAKARAFLTSRWGEVAIIDSVAVADKAFYVRMRARYAPVTCIVVHDSSAPTCGGPKRSWWWSRR
jgi:hypothetical protein